MPDAPSLLESAIEAANRGGDILMKYFRSDLVMRNKAAQSGKTYDLVSDADLESEQAIAAFLRERYPDHELLGEEALAGDVHSEHLWVIDPLDGTNNFAHQLPHFAVSIAYYHHGQPLVGVVWNPARQERFTAIRGGGAFWQQTPAKVSPANELTEALVGCGFYYDRGAMMRSTLATIEELFTKHVHGIRRFGTAALDLCCVGCGQFEGFFEFQLAPWDFAAGRLFVEEAGGRVTDATGQPVPLAKSSIVASNGALHEPLLEVTGRHHP